MKEMNAGEKRGSSVLASHQGRFLRVLTLSFVMVSFLVGGLFFESGHVYGATTFTGYISGIEKQATAYELLQKVNTARKNASVGSLKWDATLEKAAKVRAREAAIYFSHTRPTGAVWYSASSKLNGENLYVGYLATSTKANSSWMGSSSHRYNRLTSSYKSYGAAAFQGPDGYVYWVEEFSKSTSTNTSHQGTNVSKSKVGVKVSDQYLKLKSYISTTDRKTVSDTSLRVGGKYYMTLKNWNRGFSASYCQFTAGVFATTNTAVLSINSDTGAIYCKRAGVTKVTGKVAAASGITMSRIVVVRPEQVSGLVLTPFGRGVSVAWNGIAGVKGYEVYRSTTVAGTYSCIATVAAGTTTYVNGGLTTGKTYYYKVRGYVVKSGSTTRYPGYFSSPLGAAAL